MDKIDFNGMSIERTVIDKSVTYIPTVEECENIKDKIDSLFTTYEIYSGDKKGIEGMYGQYGIFWKNKGWMIDAFKRHPLYNGNYQIIVPKVKVCRRINKDDIEEFFVWLREMRSKMVMPNGCPDSHDYLEIYHDFFEIIEQYIIKSDSENPSVINEELAKTLNENAEAYNFKIRFQENQKVSRAVYKLCNDLKLNKIVDIRIITWHDDNGSEHSRTKDLGWNYQFAMFADAVNPISTEMTAVISCNPLDYYTMSFGDTWSSCHTIDKHCIRGHMNYNGEYCSGVQSYALDESTFIFYYIKNDYKGNDVENADKIKRCVFYLGEDKLIQSRVYPDGRDGGVGSFAEDIRVIVQKIITDIYDVPNLWTYKKGIDTASDMIETDPKSGHYRDYNHYSDVGVCYMKRINGYKNTYTIKVGYKKICIDCGRESSLTDNLLCCKCKSKVHRTNQCVHCGELFTNEEGKYNLQNQFICNSCGIICSSCNSWTIKDSTINDYYGNVICMDCGKNYKYLPQLNGCFHISALITTEEGTEWPIGNEGYCYCEVCDSRHDRTVITENSNHVRMCPRCRVA